MQKGGEPCWRKARSCAASACTKPEEGEEEEKGERSAYYKGARDMGIILWKSDGAAAAYEEGKRPSGEGMTRIMR